MSRWGFRRPLGNPARLDGWRLLLPIWPFWATRYDISMDEYRRGWWFASISIGVDRYGFGVVNGRPHVHGFGLRLHWGASPSKSAKFVGRHSLRA